MKRKLCGLEGRGRERGGGGGGEVAGGGVNREDHDHLRVEWGLARIVKAVTGVAHGCTVKGRAGEAGSKGPGGSGVVRWLMEGENLRSRKSQERCADTPGQV